MECQEWIQKELGVASLDPKGCESVLNAGRWHEEELWMSQGTFSRPVPAWNHIAVSNEKFCFWMKVLGDLRHTLTWYWGCGRNGRCFWIQLLGLLDLVM